MFLPFSVQMPSTEPLKFKASLPLGTRNWEEFWGATGVDRCALLACGSCVFMVVPEFLLGNSSTKNSSLIMFFRGE